MQNRAKLKFIEVEKMVNSLNEANVLLAENTEIKYEKSLKDSLIQRFEYTIEWIWKFLKYFLSEEFWENIVWPKLIIKTSYKMWILQNMDIFIKMIDKRNRLSHDYHEEFAEKSFENISYDYLEPINELINNIKNNYEWYNW